MSTSGGTGYCDCGDPEAWKTEPFCTRHADSASTSAPQASKSLLSREVEWRFHEILAAVIKYAVEVICWEYSDILPKDIEAQ